MADYHFESQADGSGFRQAGKLTLGHREQSSHPGRNPHPLAESNAQIITLGGNFEVITEITADVGIDESAKGCEFGLNALISHSHTHRYIFRRKESLKS